MAKLYFRYAAMGAGKTLHLLQVVNNYERLNKKCLVVKPAVDTKAGNKVSSRLGLERKVDFLITDVFATNGYDLGEFLSLLDNADCVVVDEAQFLTEEQVWTLYEITKVLNIPIIAYGLRTKVNGRPFEGAATLLSIADDIEEIKSICECGNKANFQIRYVNGKLDIEDEKVIIDNPNNKVVYQALCGDCYVNLKNEYLSKEKDIFNKAVEKDLVTIRCYDNEEKLTRDEALKRYYIATLSSEGSERERYTNILTQLIAGDMFCTDEF